MRQAKVYFSEVWFEIELVLQETLFGQIINNIMCKSNSSYNVQVSLSDGVRNLQSLAMLSDNYNVLQALKESN